MSFWVVLSEAKIEGVTGLKASIKKKIFIGFVNDVRRNLILWNMNWIIFDNSSLHCNKERRELYSKQGIKWISIPSYSLQLNSVEKIIGVIKKEKIKRWTINSREVNLLLLKQIIDEIYPETFRNRTLSSSKNDIQEIEAIQYRISRIQKATSIIKYWF